MMKRLVSLCLMLMMLTVLVSTAFAQEISPRADEVFHKAAATLYSDKWVTYNCVVMGIVGELKITGCWLQKKVNGSWVWQKSLPVGGYVAYNTNSMGYDIDYSSYITGAGTYRVGFTANADGHAITRYSNERTFSN